ncbi:MAG: polyketide synthase dehydratase domain-containing protein [Desulfobacteraceae bacterium]|nr:polyketide synthase dehydratase domain-containing protein [Desulfobacteraceae bacterium]
MEDLPKIIEKVKLPIEIKTDSYLLDHCFQGKAVFPAVEAMQVLASSTQTYLPHVDVALITDARFDKFLRIGATTGSLEAYNEIEVYEDGRISSKLVTRSRSPKTSITRIMEHVTVQFGGKKCDPCPLPLDFASALEGVCVDIPSDSLYRDLVPFGPAYQNVKDPLFISEKGAVANLKGVDSDGSSGPLGSPFPLDATFHVACAWGQRYSGIVGFPVGFDKRLIYSPTTPGESYICRIMPAQQCTTHLLKFNIWIYDRSGIPKEEILGLQMGDVSGGRMRPPNWISNGAEEHKLELINRQCTALSLIELKTLNGLAEKALSDRETDRFKKMGVKRGISYLAARLCCKSISRQLSGDDRETPSSSITTVSADGIRPCCPVRDKGGGSFCSVSHDSRFAIAVASNGRVGVDVEEISERVLKSRRLYMNENERCLVKGSPLGEIEASVRIWTTKEAISKALGIGLAESWERVTVKDIGVSESIMEINNKDHAAFHDAIDNHLFTIINME